MSSNLSNTVCLNMYTHLEQAIGRITECKHAGPGWSLYRAGESLNKTVARVMPDADWVIFYEFDKRKLLRARTLRIPSKKNRSYKTAVYLADIHWNPPMYVRQLNSQKWDAFLMVYTLFAYGIKDEGKMKISSKYYPHFLNAPIFHMAPCVNTRIFKPVNRPKRREVVALGAIGPKYYPIRTNIYRHLPILAEKNNWRIIVRERPPGKSLNRKISYLEKNHIVGKRYARTLALTKTFIFGTSVFKYPLLKFFEAMACQTCVLADTPLTATSLKLKPDWNFVDIDINNWQSKLKYYLTHDSERMLIAKRGYAMTMKNHTTDVRAKQLVKFLEDKK